MKGGSTDEKVRWIAVAILPNGKHRSGTFRSQGRMMRFVDRILNKFPDAVICYAIPSILTRDKRTI